MSVSDPIGDLLTRIRNAYGRKKTTVSSPASSLRGRVLDVLVQVGDAVHKGDALVLLEAMKMELRIAAPADGVVTAVRCTPGAVVERGQVLVEVTSGSEG